VLATTLASGVLLSDQPEQAFCCLTCESPTEGEQADRKANGSLRPPESHRHMVQGFCLFPCFAIDPGDVKASRRTVPGVDTRHPVG